MKDKIYVRNVFGDIYEEINIKEILTKEKYKQNCFKVVE